MAMNLSGWIVLYVNDVVIVFALGCQRRTCRRIVIGVIEKVLMVLENIGGTLGSIFFRNNQSDTNRILNARQSGCRRPSLASGFQSPIRNAYR